jgi:hypothetical protein
MRDWGGSAVPGVLYRVRHEADTQRVGHCWMRGRLKAGDLVLCMAHAGDHFYDYILVEEYANGLKGLPNSRFGAYQLGERDKIELTAREFHLLAAGEFINRGLPAFGETR